MKRIIKVIFLIVVVIICLIMMLATAWCYNDDISLAAGSVSSMMTCVMVHVAIPTILLIVFVILWYLYFKKPNNIKLISLSLVLLCWILSGRTIGYMPLPDGSVSAGWFYMETNRFYLCDGKTDCETMVDYRTKIERLSFWRVRIKNDKVDQIIFVGPLIFDKTLKLFSDVGTWTYTK